MEGSSSCTPLSAHSRIDLAPPSFSWPHHHRFSAKFSASVDCRRKIPFLYPNRPVSLTINTPSISAPLRSFGSTSSSYSGILISPRRSFNSLNLSSSRKRSVLVIAAVFERFTERAIKAVVFSQREAKALGKDMVFTQHLLLGLIAESRAPDGFLCSGITIDMARDAVRSIWHKDQSSDQNLATSELFSASDIPFSISTKRVFEAAVEYSRTMGYNFIAPEHIAIGLFTVDDGSAARVLKRYVVVHLS
ncbi:unnamed protein product [Thlaspi arvense]|uniref:Clp R domain-containing protein n=1 Tax=Thlaspi arvense TaxID=13288 RepID=A0AAU9RYQ3_THLAR|nr:unnamed protein product [Thlaspi arvense]